MTKIINMPCVFFVICIIEASEDIEMKYVGWHQVNLVEWNTLPTAGHASRVMMLLLLLGHELPSGVACSMLLPGWVLAVGYSRIALGRHHLLDVIAGFALGLAEFHSAHCLFQLLSASV